MTNRQVAQAWANQSRASGRGSNFSFEGPRLYSYRTDIARLMEWNGRSFCFITENHWTQATCKHVGHARHAIDEGVTQVVKVACMMGTSLNFSHDDPVHYLQRGVWRWVSVYERDKQAAWTSRHRGEWYLESAEHARFMFDQLQGLLPERDRVNVGLSPITQRLRDICAAQRPAPRRPLGTHWFTPAPSLERQLPDPPHLRDDMEADGDNIHF